MWIDCPSRTQSGSETKDPGLRLSLPGSVLFLDAPGRVPQRGGKGQPHPCQALSRGPTSVLQALPPPPSQEKSHP